MHLRSFYARGLVILLAASVVAGADNAPQGTAAPPLPTSLPAEQIEVREGITYAQPRGTILNLDMASPKIGDGPYPAVVCLFGGGWISGSRAGMRERIRYIAAHGYVAVAPSYRLAPEHSFPAAVADVRECVRWLRRHAREYNIDPQHIGAMGLSAGGHLACMIGLTADTDRFGEDYVAEQGASARVQAVVNFFGPGNMASKDWSALAVRKYLVPFLGGTAEEHPDDYRKASPITYISSDDPPILTFQGDQDRTVPISLSVELHERLTQAGVAEELVIVEGQGHGWREPHRSRTRRQMINFLDTHLKGQKPTTDRE